MENNIFNNIPFDLDNEIFDKLFDNDKVVIERIISPSMPNGDKIWYDQESEEIVFLLKGNAKIEFENGNTKILNEGDYLTLKSHEKHRVAYTSGKPKCIWLAIHIKDKV